MKCNFCSEDKTEQYHEFSEKHFRNKVLHKYSENRKLFGSNRKGAVVSCNVKSSFANLFDCVDSRIYVYVKPNEEVKIEFLISNESSSGILNVNYIQIPQNNLNFTMNDHGVVFGSTPVPLMSKALFSKPICVLFKSPHIGQYELPIIFSFFKMKTSENIFIVREMVVYVQQKQVIHQSVISPYTMEEVVAKTIIKSPLKSSADVEDKFRIPKHYKRVFATGLAIKSDTPQVLRELAINIESIFQIGITKDNYVNFFHHLLWYEETIIRINLKKYNMTGVVLVNTESDCLGFFVPGLGEKRPSLLLGDFLFVKPQKTDMMFEAVITEINENHVYIRGLDSRFWKHYSHAARFDIRFFPSRLALERMHHAVHSVLSGGLAARVFPVKNKKPVKLVQIKRFYNAGVAANPEQRLAVERIVSGASGAAPYLLHGPPGTGKTVTVVEAILQLVTQNSQNRIMVCTDSNMAADHVATMLIQYTSLFPDCLLLRANSKYRVWETLPECLHPYSNGSNVKNFQRVSVTDFLSYRIVIITLSHSAMFARQFHSRQRPITHLFIDEAGQASEPACLIPSAGLLRAGGALVLAGDPLQLGPVVISHAARARGLGESLMERLKNKCPLYNQMRSDPNYMVMLLNNFRSHSDILHIPNELFYKGQLRALAPEDPISRKDILGDNSESRAIIFHGVLSREQKMGKSPSFYNSMELEILQMYVKVLIENHDVKPEDIGIVAPYIRQVYKMKFWLKAQNLSTVEVGTVEAFQGKEKRVILISTVRANCGLLDHDALYQLGFLVDDKRFNVALTRAKAKAIIIGNPLCLEKDVKWLTYMEQCRRLGTYVGFESADRGARTTQQELLTRLAPMLSDLTTRAKDKIKKDIDGKGKDKKDKDRKDKDKDRKDKAKDRKDKGKKDKDIKDKDKKMKT